MPAKLTLVIGNKRHSSWSMRPWLALKRAGLAFDEELVPLRHPDTKARILAHSPSGKVPCLLVDGTAIWDSLAICEWVADAVPEAKLWPTDATARGVARSVAAEMHSGFMGIRTSMPMDLSIDPAPAPLTPAAQADVDRLIALWADCRQRFGHNGPYLFGHFTIADCMFTPVATRMRTYKVTLPQVARFYVDTLLQTAEYRAWEEAAAQESWSLTDALAEERAETLRAAGLL
jgi:glutathione S-transferase